MAATEAAAKKPTTPGISQTVQCIGRAYSDGAIDRGERALIPVEHGSHDRPPSDMTSSEEAITAILTPSVDTLERMYVDGNRSVLAGDGMGQGNVPVSMISAGEPAEVTGYCRELIETVGVGGGYILDLGAGPETGRAENIHAMVRAAKEHGVYG